MVRAVGAFWLLRGRGAALWTFWLWRACKGALGGTIVTVLDGKSGFSLLDGSGRGSGGGGSSRGGFVTLARLSNRLLPTHTNV